MKIVINKTDGNFEESIKPDIELNIGNKCFKLYGKVYLYKEKSFDIDKFENILKSKSFEETLPLLTGSYLACELDQNITIKYAVDFYGHKRMYKYENENVLQMVR